MSEQLSPLARRDRTSRPKEATPAIPADQPPRTSLRDPLTLTITGILVFVALVLLIVVRTLYPGAP